METRFRVCLHEAGHALQYSKFDWNTKFHGPFVERRDGKVQFVAGAVSPVRLNDYQPLAREQALVSIAGFKLVEHVTGLPDEEDIIRNDLASLRDDLAEGEDVNEAATQAELMLGEQLSQTGFADELRRMVRAYEFIVYNSDEATKWGWREYRPELPGKRYRVTVPVTGYYGTLVENEGGLKLVVMGEVFRPGDKFYEVRPEVRIAEPGKLGADRAVQAWNGMAHQTVNKFIGPLTKEDEETLLDALSSNHRFAERSHPCE